MDEHSCQVGWGLLSWLTFHVLQLCLCPCLPLPLPPPKILAILGLCPTHPIALSPVGNLSQAVENVLSVLLFYPEDEAAKKALNEYQVQLGEPSSGLGPREVTLPPDSLTLR